MNFVSGKQTIIVDDCLSVLKITPEQSIDVVCTSPPYNIGIAYHTYHDKKPKDAYLAWMSDIGAEIQRILKPTGAFFLNLGSTNVDPWIHLDVANMFRERFILQNHIIWVKSLSIRDDTYGHFKPINSKRYLNHNHESIFHFTLYGNAGIDRLAIGVPFADKSNIARRGHAQDKRCAGDIWYIPYETVVSKLQKYNHPSAFPLELPMKCLKMHGATGVVLDPFAGIGTTLLAAERSGWTGIGIEIDAQYATTAQARLEAYIALQNAKEATP